MSSETTPNAGPEDDLAWMLPGHVADPALALARIQVICRQIPELYGAMFTILGTHMSVPKPHLAAAVKLHRRDLDDLSRDDVAGLLTAIWNGGRDGFDAVLRSRRRGERGAAALPWMKE